MENVDITLFEYLKLKFLVVLYPFLIPYIIAQVTFTGLERRIADPSLQLNFGMLVKENIEFASACFIHS